MPTHGWGARSQRTTALAVLLVFFASSVSFPREALARVSPGPCLPPSDLIRQHVRPVEPLTRDDVSLWANTFSLLKFNVHYDFLDAELNVFWRLWIELPPIIRTAIESAVHLPPKSMRREFARLRAQLKWPTYQKNFLTDIETIFTRHRTNQPNINAWIQDNARRAASLTHIDKQYVESDLRQLFMDRVHRGQYKSLFAHPLDVRYRSFGKISVQIGDAVYTGRVYMNLLLKIVYVFIETIKLIIPFRMQWTPKFVTRQQAAVLKIPSEMIRHAAWNPLDHKHLIKMGEGGFVSWEPSSYKSFLAMNENFYLMDGNHRFALYGAAESLTNIRLEKLSFQPLGVYMDAIGLSMPRDELIPLIGKIFDMKLQSAEKQRTLFLGVLHDYVREHLR